MLSKKAPEDVCLVFVVQCSYLDRKKVVGGDEAAFEYRWGSRAEKELTKREVLQFVSEVRLDYFLFIVVELILEGFSRDP